MVKKSMDDLLKRRMSAAQQASELEVGNEAYETMFQAKADVAAPRFCELPIKSLCPFRTADIGFRPYLQEEFPELRYSPERARKILLAWFGTFREKEADTKC